MGVKRGLVDHRDAAYDTVLSGSPARGEDRPDSDIDLLVDFLPHAEIGLLDYVGLSLLTTFKVDLISKENDSSPASRVRDARVRSVYAYLQDTVEAAYFLAQFVDGIAFSALQDSEFLRSAVFKRWLAVGGAAGPHFGGVVSAKSKRAKGQNRGG